MAVQQVLDSAAELTGRARGRGRESGHDVVSSSLVSRDREHSGASVVHTGGGGDVDEGEVAGSDDEARPVLQGTGVSQGDDSLFRVEQMKSVTVNPNQF